MTGPLLRKLINFGLSEKEAEIYLMLLKLEVAKANEVAEQTGINRSSTYVVLESLKRRGLVGVSDDKKIRRYVAVSPDNLLHMALTTARKQEKVAGDIESIVPELEALRKHARRRPSVRVFEGVNGAREVYWDIFSTKAKDLRVYANPINIFNRIPGFQDHDKERGKRKIKMQAINPATKEVLELYKHARPHQPFEVALIPEKSFKFSSDMGIYADRVAFVSPQDNFGVVIESQEIAEMLKHSFDLSWKEAKRLNKQIKDK
ncbi:MAG: helix-turn-helix domain-containing protein [Candidatus Andersenbacteria bacterium]